MSNHFITGTVPQIIGRRDTRRLIHAYRAACHPHTSARRRAADVALQLGLGLLPERRPRVGAYCIDRPCRGRGDLVSCSANSLDSSRRSLSTERPPCFVARPHRSTGYGYGLASRLTANFARSFIVGTYGTGHQRLYTLML